MSCIRMCCISKAVTNATPNRDNILEELRSVKVHGNPILQEIVKQMPCIRANPLIIVDGTVYRIKFVEKTDKQLTLLQQLVTVYNKGSGKTMFDVVSFRKVRITFDN